MLPCLDRKMAPKLVFSTYQPNSQTIGLKFSVIRTYRKTTRLIDFIGELVEIVQHLNKNLCLFAGL